MPWAQDCALIPEKLKNGIELADNLLEDACIDQAQKHVQFWVWSAVLFKLS